MSDERWQILEAYQPASIQTYSHTIFNCNFWNPSENGKQQPGDWMKE